MTSRITLIDKAVIPIGSSVLRLEEFDESRRREWSKTWNAVNAGYFEQTQVRPFDLPEVGRLVDLARQPLLLLMLALYDSQANQLGDVNLDQTMLYHSLLSRFVERERTKGEAGPRFKALPPAERQALIDADLGRLGVAAMGMFNRQALHLNRRDLNAEIAYFDTGQTVPTRAGAVPLTQADLLLGIFFFIHESRSRSGDPDDFSQGEAAAFEFLHNTFGEFLAADFLLRQVLAHSERVSDLRKNPGLATVLQEQLTLPDKNWFACLSYTVLHSRPVVLEMLREWLPHRLAQVGRDRAEIATCLRLVVDRQLEDILHAAPPSWFTAGADKTPYEPVALLGHLSIYTLNLVVLAAVVGDDAYEFRDSNPGGGGATTRPWDRLIQQWRSWFSLDAMAGVTAALRTERAREVVLIWPQISRPVPLNRSSVEALLNLSEALSDDLSTGLAGLAMERLHGLSSSRTMSVLDALERQGIDASVERLAHAARQDRTALYRTRFQTTLWNVVGYASALSSTDDLRPGSVWSVFELLQASGGPEAILHRNPVRHADLPKRLVTLSPYEVALLTGVKSRFEPLWQNDLIGKVTMSMPELLQTPLAAPLLRAARLRARTWGYESLSEMLRQVEPGPALDVETAIEYARACVEFLAPSWNSNADEVLAVQLSSATSLMQVPVLSWIELLEIVGTEDTALPRSASLLRDLSVQLLSSGENGSRELLTAMTLDGEAWEQRRGNRDGESRALRAVDDVLARRILVVLLRAARRWDKGQHLLLFVRNMLLDTPTLGEPFDPFDPFNSFDPFDPLEADGGSPELRWIRRLVHGGGRASDQYVLTVGTANDLAWLEAQVTGEQGAAPPPEPRSGS